MLNAIRKFNAGCFHKETNQTLGSLKMKLRKAEIKEHKPFC